MVPVAGSTGVVPVAVGVGRGTFPLLKFKLGTVPLAPGTLVIATGFGVEVPE